jgi:hypothetical protein
MDMPTRRRLARTVRRLSSVRAAKHGRLPEHNGTWWAQIEALAAEHQLPISWEEWCEVSTLLNDHRRYREETR